MPKSDPPRQPDKADLCARCSHYRGVHDDGACNGPGLGGPPVGRELGCSQNCPSFVEPVMYRRAQGRPSRPKPES